MNSAESVYAEVIQMLQTHFAELQVRRPGFSLRSFARVLNLTPAQLSETLSGKRKITRKIALRVFERLGVDPSTAQHLIGRLPEKQKRRRNKTQSKTRGQVLRYVQLSTDEFKIVADWYHFAILSLAETKSFKSDPTWIAKRLNIAEPDAKRAIERLLRLGLIAQKSGKLVATGKRFATSNDIPDASIRKNHAQGLEQARNALDQVPVELREFAASIIAADPRLLPQAKARLRELKREITQLLESGEKREVYRLSIQLFPVSR